MERKGDIIINGMGSSSGGVVNKVLINGKGTINSDVDCLEFHINGTGKVLANVKGEEGKINGSGTIEGSLSFDKFRIDGQASIHKDATVKNLKISGKGNFCGSVKSEEFHIRGTADIGHDCEAEIFKSEGNFSIGGLLNADTINIKLHGKCEAKEMGGHTINVRDTSTILNLFKSVFPNILKVETIEGDEISLENTQAHLVSGNNVTIGANCVIEKVEYRDTLVKDPSAVVKEEIKL